MTKKRFTLKGLVEGVPNICDNGEIIEQEEVVELLNHLHEENTQLRKLLDIGRTNAKSILDVLNDQEQRLNHLHEENQTLKDENWKLKRANQDWHILDSKLRVTQKRMREDIQKTLQKYFDKYTQRALESKAYGDVTEAIEDIADELGVDLE